jgi:hypothetical protein
MAHDFAIEELKATTPEFGGVVHPQFSKDKKQFRLIGYDATVKTGSGAPQQLTVKIDSQRVETFDLPGKVTAAMTLPVGAVEVSFVFTNYQIKKR